MKNLFKIAALFLFLGSLVSCESDDEKFSGSPVGVMPIETIKGSITTDVTTALAGQKVKFVAHLPEGMTFNDTVRVEVSAINKTYSRIREYLIFQPNTNSMEGEIESPGGSIFETTFELSLTAIELYTVIPGKHILITSDPVVIQTGSSAIPTTNPNICIVRLVWQGANSSTNNVRLAIDRPDPVADANMLLNFTGAGKNYSIFKTGTQSTTNTQSTAEGDYIFSITGITQQTPVDFDYKIIVSYPNGEAEAFSGTYEGMQGGATPSPLKPILKVTKTGMGDAAVFSSEPLN